MAKKKSKWINLPVFWRGGSVAFLSLTLGYFAWSLFIGLEKLDLVIVLLGIVAVTAFQVEYLLFKYFEHEKIDAKQW